MDSIQQLAAELPECFGEGALTRSGYTKSVADLFPLNDILRSSATKSGKTDDAEVTKNIYVVNYADDGGFAILAADTLMETILAYSDQGINWPDMFTCNNTSNGKPVAGCVAIAMLNIMAANSYPTSFQVSNGWYTCYWDNWRSYLYGSWFPADIRTTGGPLPPW